MHPQTRATQSTHWDPGVLDRNTRDKTPGNYVSSFNPIKLWFKEQISFMEFTVNNRPSVTKDFILRKDVNWIIY